MDTTEKDIRNLLANSGELDRDEVAMLLLQLVNRIQNLERAPQRTWVGLTEDEIHGAITWTLTELRRLHALNQELLGALKEAELVLAEKLRRLAADPTVSPTTHRIRAVIARATGGEA